MWTNTNPNILFRIHIRNQILKQILTQNNKSDNKSKELTERICLSSLAYSSLLSFSAYSRLNFSTCSFVPSPYLAASEQYTDMSSIQCCGSVTISFRSGSLDHNTELLQINIGILPGNFSGHWQKDVVKLVVTVADPDPYVLGPPGSRSVSSRYGSGSFYQ